MSKQNGRDNVPDSPFVLAGNEEEFEEGGNLDEFRMGDVRQVAMQQGGDRFPFGTIDAQGRTRELLSPGGDSVQFGYVDNKAELPNSYVARFKDGRVERGRQDAAGGWTIESLVNGEWKPKTIKVTRTVEGKEVQVEENLGKSVTKVFGNVNTGVLSFVYKGQDGKSMVHEAHPGGQVLKRSEADTPFTAERDGRTLKMHPARSVITRDRVTSDYTYATEKDPAGKDIPVAQTRKLTDSQGNIIEYAVKNKGGTIDVYRPKAGEKGLDPAKLNDPAKMAEYKVNFTGSNNPLDQVVSIDPDHADGRRRTTLGNGDLVERRPSDGKIVRQHPGGRLTEYTINNGKAELGAFESSITGERYQFKSEGGKLTRVEMTPPNGPKQVLVLKDNVWVDEVTNKPPEKDGKVDNISFERTADGIAMIRKDNRGIVARREFHSDGSELICLPNKNGEVKPKIVISSAGVATQIDNDATPPTMTILYPRSNQPLSFAKNGDSYVEGNGLVAPEKGTPAIGDDGNITWKRPDGKTVVWDRRAGPQLTRVVRQPARGKAA